MLLAILPLAGCGGDRKLLLLITVDTLRADHVGAYGATGLTPALDALAAESVVFERAYAPASCTLPSIAALMTSRHPEELGIESNMSALPPVTTLAGWLRERGWRTGAVVSNLVLRRSSGVDAGFERYDDQMRQRERVREAPERTAVNTTRAALKLLGELLAGGSSPVFLWVHYQDPHGPYTPPPGLRRRFLKAEQQAPDGPRELPLSAGVSGLGGLPTYQVVQDRREVAFYRAGYKGEVAHTDEAIGALLDGLEQRGLGGAVVVFTADHGESLGEHDYWFAHGERLDEALVRVPLLVRVPGRARERRQDVASLLDLFPTVTGLARVQAPNGLRGRDLLTSGAAARSSAIYMSTLKVTPEPQRALVARGYHFFMTGNGEASSERLFRLGDEAEALAVTEAPALEAMHRAMKEARGSLSRPGTPARQDLSPEDREGLAALGYVGN